MDEILLKGSIVEIPNSSLGELIVVDTCIYNEDIYLLVAPLDSNNEGNDEFDIDESILLRVEGENNKSVIITDEYEIEKIVGQMIVNETK